MAITPETTTLQVILIIYDLTFIQLSLGQLQTGSGTTTNMLRNTNNFCYLHERNITKVIFSLSRLFAFFYELLSLWLILIRVCSITLK